MNQSMQSQKEYTEEEKKKKDPTSSVESSKKEKEPLQEDSFSSEKSQDATGEQLRKIIDHETSMNTKEWSVMHKEREEFKDKYWRLLAESENARKRMQKDKEDFSRFATESLILEWLAPLDQFEKALQFADQSSDEIKNWAQGFHMILQQMQSVLSNQGVCPFDATGKVFDPRFHEAVETIETDEYPDHTVIKQFQCGYQRKDRVIRPAKVQVAKTPSRESIQEDPSADSQIDSTEPVVNAEEKTTE